MAAYAQTSAGISKDTITVESILNEDIGDRTEREWLLSLHARSRAQQRRIAVSEIRSVLTNASKHETDTGAWEYRFAGVCVIVDASESIVLTVYPESGYGIHLDKHNVTEEMVHEHERSARRLKTRGTWKSHTVAVIDQSGSMRKADIDAKVTRSDLVWLCLAVDLVRNGLLSGERGSSDVLSVVSMKENAEILVDRQPFDWMLFNTIVDLMQTEKPSNAGNYVPALDWAEYLLSLNRTQKCASCLLFLSDGAPSDQLRRGECSSIRRYAIKQRLSKKMSSLAEQFGKRLNLCFIAVGSEEQTDFSVLKTLADEARQYECHSIFEPASLSAGALSTAMRSMSTSTTATTATLSLISETEELRPYIKMRVCDIGSPVVTDTWNVVLNRNLGGGKRSIVKASWTNGWVTHRYDTLCDPRAIGIAWEKRWFGEGKERLAAEFREIGPDERTFVGPPMVLKASITLNKAIDVDSKEFHKRFCKSQFKAHRFAEMFNEQVDALGISPKLPRIEFLRCWVYMIEKEGEERKGYLVEPQLDAKSYKKFSDNQGNVFEDAHVGVNSSKALLTIEEEESEDSSDGEEIYSEDEIPIFSCREECREEKWDILQAFSCFTYYASRRKYLVCDLQGTVEKSLGSLLYRLTDPVIHTSQDQKDFLIKNYGRENARRERFGKVDCGQEGIDSFFRSHTCTKLCRMLRSRRVRHLDGRNLVVPRNEKNCDDVDQSCLPDEC